MKFRRVEVGVNRGVGGGREAGGGFGGRCCCGSIGGKMGFNIMRELIFILVVIVVVICGLVLLFIFGYLRKLVFRDVFGFGVE